MTIQNFKLTSPAASRPSFRPASRPERPSRPHAVPVKEMAAPTQKPISRADAEDAVEIARLLDLPFPAFAQSVARLLETLGYANVEAMKAMHGHGKGRNAHGGYDLRMYLPTRLTRGLVIAQVKQYTEPVPRSFVDELRGTMLRLGASQGLLVTTSTFSASAIEAAQSAQHAAPVRLIDGTELARLLRDVRATPAVAPSPTRSRPAPLPTPGSGLRPLSREESERLHQEFLDGLGAPPNEKGHGSTHATPERENVTLVVRVAVCLLSATPGGRTGDGTSEVAGERRRS